MNAYSALWILMAWCFSTRVSVAIVLNTYPCVSRCLRVNQAQQMLRKSIVVSHTVVNWFIRSWYLCKEYGICSRKNERWLIIAMYVPKRSPSMKLSIGSVSLTNLNNNIWAWYIFNIFYVTFLLDGHRRVINTRTYGHMHNQLLTIAKTDWHERKQEVIVNHKAYRTPTYIMLWLGRKQRK